MMSHVQTVNNQGVKLETLNKYDFFIHLCCHLYKEATTLPWVKMGRDMTFYKFCDIYMLMFAFLPIEIDKLFCRAKELGAELSVVHVARQGAGLLGGDVGIGTIFYLLCNGFVMQMVYNVLHFEPRNLQHLNLLQMVCRKEDAKV